MQAALAVAAASSIDELNISLVAKSLGVGMTSVYWHVRNKSALLDAMTDHALRTSGLPRFPESGDWRESLVTYARAVRQTFLDDPVLADLILIRGAMSPLARRLRIREIEKTISIMIAGGLEEQQARDTYFAMSELVRGSVLLQRLMHKHRAAGEATLAGDISPIDDTAPDNNWPFELLLTSLVAHSAQRTAE